MWNGQKFAMFPSMLGKFGSAGACGGINEIEMHDLAKAVRQIDDALERAIVILDTAQAAAQAFLFHGVGKGGFQSSFPRIEAILVDAKHFAEYFWGEGLVFEIIEGSHDAGHVYPLLVGVQAYRSRHLGL